MNARLAAALSDMASRHTYSRVNGALTVYEPLTADGLPVCTLAGKVGHAATARQADAICVALDLLAQRDTHEDNGD